MSGNTNDVVGYFYWSRTQSGVPTCAKIDKEIYYGRMQVAPASFRDREDKIIKKFALTKDEWAMDLAMLAARFPCPPTSSPS